MTKNKRYLALDVLRGITISGMILVNMPGSWSYVYAPLKHADWHGCTPTDLVFPFFLFVMGVSIFFSFSKYNDGLNSTSLKKIGKRSLMIFMIGLFLNSFPQWEMDFSKLRIMGVLQRIAVVYAFSSILILSLKKKGLFVASILLLLIHWAGLYIFGGNAPYSLQENATIGIDTFILGNSHMYHGFGTAFDPEGLFSSISSIVSVLIGYAVGMLINKSNKQRLPINLSLWGIVLVATGLIWSAILPLNKPLWTGSYVLYTAGLAMLLLSLLVWIVDIKEYKKWTSFFVVFGVNPLFIFAFSILWTKIILKIIWITNSNGELVNGYNALYQEIFVPLAGNMNGSLFFGLAHIVFFWFLGWILYKNRIFIKV